MTRKRTLNLLAALATVLLLVTAVYRPPGDPWLENRIPEPAPYTVSEAKYLAPPYEESWETTQNPGTCGSCHPRVFEEWNGSMMANSWRDPAWRAAFLLLARKTATDGNCDVPAPPDGTPRAALNPFAGEGCTSNFDLGDGVRTFQRSGSLLDGFCSRCHMPTNYLDNIPLQNVGQHPSGVEDAVLNPWFDPTSDNDTGRAFATDAGRFRNTDTGKRGLFCGICHSMAESRFTPYANYSVDDDSYVAALGDASRSALAEQGALAAEELEPYEVPAPDRPNLGYGVGAGAFRLSPNAIVHGTTFGPLTAGATAGQVDPYVSLVFGVELHHEEGAFQKHDGVQHAKFQRAEMCATCHDVTNPLTVKNELGLWVGGFPIERTYTEWWSSRYADRPGNDHFDPSYKRDCQTCHMQQSYGQPGTAQTLYRNGRPVAPLTGRPAEGGPQRSVYYSHHFIGGNAYIPRLIGATVTESGRVEAYPELSVYSFSSKDKNSPYANAFWDVPDNGAPIAGAPTQHARLAWDRLRNVLELELEAPRFAGAGNRVPLSLRVTNSGSGHNFPTGFPEGRVAWIALHAWDLATGERLPIHDAHWNRTSLGVGDLTREDWPDPNFPECEHNDESWILPAGSPDPWAYQFRAVATRGDGCPTLDLVYAVPLNRKTNEDGFPVDAEGRPLGPDNPRGLPVFEDLDGDGDLFDDAFLMDRRLRPLPHAEATVDLSDRYSVVIPEGTLGPVAVTAAVYYQSLEALVAKKFLGNLADTDLDHHLEPCVLGGSCDGRSPTTEPAVVEGAPPVPMEVVSRVMTLPGHPDRRPPTATLYPEPGHLAAYADLVPKARFSEPVTGVDARSFTLTDEQGLAVPAFVDRIGPGTWGLFPHRIHLQAGARYTARLDGDICDASDNCLTAPLTWSFQVAETPSAAVGTTDLGHGFPGDLPSAPNRQPELSHIESLEDGSLRLVFTEPVMNVTAHTVQVFAEVCENPDRGTPLRGRLSTDPEGIVWTFVPDGEGPGLSVACLEVSDEVYDLRGGKLKEGVRRSVHGPRR